MTITEEKNTGRCVIGIQQHKILITTSSTPLKLTNKGMINYLEKYPNKTLYDVYLREEKAVKLSEPKESKGIPVLSVEDYGDVLEGGNLIKLYENNELRYFDGSGQIWNMSSRESEVLIGLYLEDRSNFLTDTKLIIVDVPEGFTYKVKESKGVNKGEKVIVYQEVN